MKTQITFFKIDAGSKKSMRFYRDFLTYFGYKIKYEDATKLKFSNGGTEFFIFHSVYTTGSCMYILNTGINAIFFKVPSKRAVNKFYNEFLKPRKIEPRWNGKAIKRFMRTNAKEEGKYSLFFDTPERIEIGILTD